MSGSPGKGRRPAQRDKASLEAEVRRLRRDLRAAVAERDATKQLRVRDELEDSLSHFVDLYDLAPVGYLNLDRQGIIRSVNLRAVEMLGRARSVLVGYPFARLVRSADRRRLLGHLSQLRRGQAKGSVELEIVPPRVSPVPVQLISVVAGEDASVAGFSIAMVDLTERRRAEAALQRERGLLGSVMSATDVMLVYLDREFNFIWVNDAYARTCGLRPEDMAGKNHFLLYPDAENEEIFRRVRDSGEQVFFKDKPFEFPDQPERGTTYWDWSLTPVKDDAGTVVGLVFSLRDTTRYRRSQLALAASEKRYRVLFEQSPDAVLIHREGKITFVNPAAVALCGAGDGEQLVGRSPLDLFHPNQHAYFRERSRRVLKGESVPLVEERLLGLDGGVHEVEVSSTLVETDEGPAIQVILHDITVRKRTERELEGALVQARRQEVERAALLHVARTVLERPAFAEGAKVILSSCKAVVGAGAGLVALCAADGSGTEIVHFDTGGLDNGVPAGAAMPMRGLRERVRATRQTVIENSFAGSRWAEGMLEGHIGLSSVLLAPLVVGEEVLGYLGLANKKGGFSEDDGRLVSAFAEMAAVALLNSRTFEVLERNQEVLESQVRERTATLAATNALLEGERRRMFSLLEELPVFVYLRAPDCSIRFANRYFREHFGDPEGRHCYELLGAGDAPCAGCQAANVLATHTGASWEWTSPGGRSYQIHNYPFTDTDGSELVLELGIDVTELRQSIRAEQRARQAADTLRAGSLALTRTLELDAVLAALLEHLRGLVPYDRARVMVKEGEARLVVRAAVDADEDAPLPPLERAAFDSTENPVIDEVLRTGRATVIADMHTHPEWGQRMDPTFAHSWMGVPLLARGRIVGMFSLSKHEAGFFTAEHLHLAEALSAQASVAVENALLFEEVQASRERMQTLGRRLVDVQESERRTIARELHDEAGQSLTSLLFGLRMLEREHGDGGGVAVRAGELTRTAEVVLEDLHRLAANLRPASLDHLGLEAAIRQHLAGIESTTGLTVRFKAHGLEGERLPSEVETALYRVVQEALTNVVRHARASAVDVLAERRGGRVVVMVEDNGVGFDPEQTPASGQLGLLGMRERAETLGGTLTLESSPSAGTTVVVEVPDADSHPDR
jgi:PAS domain S-box-containing protein